MSDQKHTMKFTFPQSTKKHKPHTPAGEEKNTIEVSTWDEKPGNKNECMEQEKQDSFIPKPEKVIDFSSKREKKKQGLEPFWDDGNRSLSPKLPPKNRKGKWSFDFKLPWPIIGAVFSAIIVGLGLGVVVFQFMMNGQAVMGGTKPDAIPVSGQTDGAFPTVHMDVIQGAAFSEKEIGDLIVAQTEQKGIPAALIPGDNDAQYMFVGLAGDQSKASELSKRISEKGQDVYTKTHTIEAGSISSAGEASASWFSNAYSAFKFMSGLSAELLIQDDPKLVNEEALHHLTSDIEELRVNRDFAFDLMSEDIKELSLRYADHLFKAEQQLLDYQHTSDETNLWMMQQTLLRVMADYQVLVDAMKKEE